MHPFLIALQFLTRLPVITRGEWRPENTGKSLLYYPLVGLIIGGILVMLAYVLQQQSPLLVAALLLCCWVLITGGLHLDGLADSADAWAGCRGDKQRALDIMKDSRAGPMAIVILVLVLLLKFSALTVLVQLESHVLLLIAPMLSRAGVILLFMTTAYVREQGLGSHMQSHLPRPAAQTVLALIVLLTMLISGFELSLLLFVAALFTLFLLRHLMLQRIQGMTGDTLGASIEIIETVSVCIMAL